MKRIVFVVFACCIVCNISAQNNFPPNGNVGIGTTMPEFSLQIVPKGYGGIIIGGNTANGGYTDLILGISDTSNGYALLQGIKGSGSLWGDIVLNKRGGNVGIGTASPTEKLAVNGNVRARKVIVTQSNWADYVFEPSYKLPSLDSVSAFIKVNKHLPEMPSAAEVEKAGQDIGEVQKLLLKKVEELTLYVIELQKEVKVLKETSK